MSNWKGTTCSNLEPVKWVARPGRSEACPEGLEFLTNIKHIIISQTYEEMRNISNYAYKFILRNDKGEGFYYAVETKSFTRYIFGSSQPSSMSLMDNQLNEIIIISWRLRCCLTDVQISSPPGTVLGTVEQKFKFLKPTFDVKISDGTTVLRIKKNKWSFFNHTKSEFTVKIPGESLIGTISKTWPDFCGPGNDLDHFGIDLDLNLNAPIKAILIGATFLIAFRYFRKNQLNDVDLHALLNQH